MSKLVHAKADSSIDLILETVSRDGGIIIDNVLSQSQLDQLKSEMAPWINPARGINDDFLGRETKRVGALMARSALCRQLVMHPLAKESAEKYLAPFCQNIQLNLSQVISVGPGETRQPLHRDRELWGNYIPVNIETQFSAVWAMTDFTFDNGGTSVVPGSNHWDSSRRPVEGEIEAVQMKAGSLFLYNGSVLHGAGTNVTEMRREGVFFHYTLSWLRQEENQYLSCPPEVAKDLDPELRKLLGYSMGGGVLGFYTPPFQKAGDGIETKSPEYLFGE